MMVNPSNAIVLQVAELARNLQDQPFTDDVDQPLRELVATAAESVPGADHAAIVIVRRDGARTLAATARYPIELDKFHHPRNEGPCDTSTWEHQVVRVDDVRVEQRWRTYCRDIADATPIRSIMSFQLFSDRRTMGLLTFYSERPYVFDAESMELGWIMATHTALAWNMLRHEQQFRSALASRDIIGQAKGMIMERFDLDPVRAFELLKQLSQSSNTPLVAVARQLVGFQHPRQDHGAPG